MRLPPLGCIENIQKEGEGYGLAKPTPQTTSK